MKPERQCGDCQLCCKLLPMKAGDDTKAQKVMQTTGQLIELGMMTANDAIHMTPDFDKPAGERCPHQRHHKGCAIYARRPFGCRFWNCRWLVNDDTAELSRPDRSHYVVDVSPDFITTDDGHIPVIQVWVDPNYPDAHRDPKLRDYLERRGREGHAALIRFSSRDGFVLFPPALTGGQGWIEKRSQVRAGPEHSIDEKIAALGEYKVAIR